MKIVFGIIYLFFFPTGLSVSPLVEASRFVLTAASVSLAKTNPHWSKRLASSLPLQASRLRKPILSIMQLVCVMQKRDASVYQDDTHRPVGD